MNVAGEWRGINRHIESSSECCLIGLGPGPDPAVSAPTDAGRRAPMPHPPGVQGWLQGRVGRPIFGGTGRGPLINAWAHAKVARGG